jgi:hypothetical protein
MKKLFYPFIPVIAVVVTLTSCLKSNDKYESYDSLKPIADIPKAPANTVTVSTAPTNSWFTLDSLPAGVDYNTAVHLSAADHVGDVTLHMKIDKDAANAFISRVPFFRTNIGTSASPVYDTTYCALIPDSLYTVPSLDVKIADAGVFSTGDFTVHIKTAAVDADGTKLFKHTPANKHKAYILPVSIDNVASAPYDVSSNFKTVLWYIKVK